jgi:hypothetical protein
VQVTIREGWHWSKADGYLDSAIGKNVKVVINVLVENIQFEDNQASGFNYTDKQGKKFCQS